MVLPLRSMAGKTIVLWVAAACSLLLFCSSLSGESIAVNSFVTLVTAFDC
jgi:hypothetical protein